MGLLVPGYMGTKVNKEERQRGGLMIHRYVLYTLWRVVIESS